MLKESEFPAFPSTAQFSERISIQRNQKVAQKYRNQADKNLRSQKENYSSRGEMPKRALLHSKFDSSVTNEYQSSQPPPAVSRSLAGQEKLRSSILLQKQPSLSNNKEKHKLVNLQEMMQSGEIQMNFKKKPQDREMVARRRYHVDDNTSAKIQLVKNKPFLAPLSNSQVKEEEVPLALQIIEKADQKKQRKSKKFILGSQENFQLKSQKQQEVAREDLDQQNPVETFADDEDQEEPTQAVLEDHEKLNESLLQQENQESPPIISKKAQKEEIEEITKEPELTEEQKLEKEMIEKYGKWPVELNVDLEEDEVALSFREFEDDEVPEDFDEVKALGSCSPDPESMKQPLSFEDKTLAKLPETVTKKFVALYQEFKPELFPKKK